MKDATRKTKLPAKWRFRLWLLKNFMDSKEGKQMLDKIKNFGAGYRTYGVVAVMLICVAAEKLFGWDVPGFDVPQDWLVVVLGALGLGSLRAAVPSKKIEM